MDRLPSLVRPLLVSDLPVYLWWREPLDCESLLLNSLAKAADRIIVDSATLGDQNFKTLESLIQKTSPWAAVSDLSWAALTPWRMLLAGFFDLPELHPYLRQISRVEFSCIGAGSPHLPTQAALLAAWLSSTLGWKPVSAPTWSEQGVCEWALTEGNRPVRIVTKLLSAERLADSLGSVKLLTETEPILEFAAIAGADGKHLEGKVLRGREVVARRLLCLPESGESALLAEDLERPARDRVFDRSVEFLAAIHELQ